MSDKQVSPSDRLQGVDEYYFSTKLREIEEMNQSGTRVINLGIGSPDLAPPTSVVKALAKASAKPGQSRYQSYRGVQPLRQAFADWYHKYFQVSLDANSEVLPLIGSKEGIMHISMAFLNPGDLALVPNPGYPAYAACTKLAGGIPQAYELTAGNNWKPDITTLEDLDLSKVKLMWINYPHMPTGANIKKEEYDDLVRLAEENEIVLVNDNPYAFILNKNPLSVFSNRAISRNVLELNSLSKSHNMAGWRVGAVVGNATLIDTILRFKSNMDSGMFLPVQLAAAKALGEEKGWYKSQNKKYKKRRKIAYTILNDLDCEYVKGGMGMFVWARIPAEWTSAESYSDYILNNSRVFITPGHIFGSQGAPYLRISLCSPITELREAQIRIIKLKNKRKHKPLETA